MKATASVRNPFGRALLLVALAAVLGTGLWTLRALQRSDDAKERPLDGLRIFGEVPDFSLVERDKRRISRADLREKVWIANFIYTHCTDTCPLQSAQIARLQEEFKTEPDIRFVSITVDPEQDTRRPFPNTRYGSARIASAGSFSPGKSERSTPWLWRDSAWGWLTRVS